MLLVPYHPWPVTRHSPLCECYFRIIPDQLPSVHLYLQLPVRRIQLHPIVPLTGTSKLSPKFKSLVSMAFFETTEQKSLLTSTWLSIRYVGVLCFFWGFSSLNISKYSHIPWLKWFPVPLLSWWLSSGHTSVFQCLSKHGCKHVVTRPETESSK